MIAIIDYSRGVGAKDNTIKQWRNNTMQARVQFVLCGT